MILNIGLKNVGGVYIVLGGILLFLLGSSLLFFLGVLIFFNVKVIELSNELRFFLSWSLCFWILLVELVFCFFSRWGMGEFKCKFCLFFVLGLYLYILLLEVIVIL